ncbi:putative PEP-binding protein [Lentzea sp. NPDC051838]|uniref:putative PEP-binding protein n=1 Tax=Lentzea sp. NPDC051838 TaxID=3154849 RepID=UPI00342A9FB5
MTPFVTGLPSSPGTASGEIVLTSDQAVAARGGPVILVIGHTTPADVPGILASAAVLTSGGGFSSHAAIIARGAGVPAVCGATDLRIDLTAGTVTANGRVLRAGDQISVDGGSGDVFAGVVEIGSDDELPAHPGGGLGIGVRANADTPRDVRAAIGNGADGIGLCRTEHQFLGDRLPLLRKALADAAAFDEVVRVQRADFRDLFRAAGSVPVTVRLLDAPTHEFLPEAAEANPMLGVRGVRQAVLHDRLYRAQARALFLAWTDVTDAPALDVMVPMVSLPEELVWAAALVRRAADDVAGETGVAVPYRIGSMIETPRAALLADRLAVTARFLSFGTNDLTQLTYGFSRDDVERQVLPDYRRLGLVHANPFERLDPGGVGALMEIAAGKARSVRPDITLSLCGEQGGDPESIALCARLGLDYVSCSPARIPMARLAAKR